MFTFKKKKVYANQQEIEQKDLTMTKYPKPKIILIDIKDDSEEKLSAEGYNVVSGSFGIPYKIAQSDGFTPVICNGELPNCSEQEIAATFANLSSENRKLYIPKKNYSER